FSIASPIVFCTAAGDSALSNASSRPEFWIPMRTSTRPPPYFSYVGPVGGPAAASIPRRTSRSPPRPRWAERAMSGAAPTVCAVHGIPPLDPDQRAVLGLPDGASAVILGAPGTGRTTTAVALVADRVTSGRLAAEEVLLLAPRRTQASRLR